MFCKNLDEGVYSRHDQSIYLPNDQWDILNLGHLIFRKERRAYEIAYEVHFRRKPLYYLITLVSPIVINYLLSGLAFFLPSDDGEKLSFGVTILLAQIVAVSAMSDIFPASSTSIPLLLYFVSAVTLHMAIMCFESVIGKYLIMRSWFKNIYYQTDPMITFFMIRLVVDIENDNQLSNLALI